MFLSCPLPKLAKAAPFPGGGRWRERALGEPLTLRKNVK